MKNPEWFAYGNCITGFRGGRTEVTATRMGNSDIWWITKTVHGVETEHCTYRGDMGGVMEYMEERYGNVEGKARESCPAQEER